MGLYFMFVMYQFLVKINEDSEKEKVKYLLYELMDSVNGIPIINKNERLVIKWDMVFKKLIDNKEFQLYDKIIKAKTIHIDSYINKYPSLLMDETVDLRESRINMDLNSTVRGKHKKNKKVDEELVKEDENKRKLFIRDIKHDTMTFMNYNSSIHVDVMLKNEYMPENEPEIDILHDPNYDGFSVWLAYKNNKYNVVPRVIVSRKNINKEKWFFDNIDSLLKSATAIVNGDTNYTLHVDNFKLLDYLEDIVDEKEYEPSLTFQRIENDNLIFISNNRMTNTKTAAYCVLKTAYNKFEVELKQIVIKVGEDEQKIELEKIVAIGSSFQPIVTLLEKMPSLIKNIELVINNKDINSIVIS
ncbi:MAG: hypothetical protein WBL93_03000 [Lutisporaceae bacterium]